MRTQRWSVAITAAASTRPIMMLTRCLWRYAVESPWVRISLLEVADHTSRVPMAEDQAGGAEQHPVEARDGDPAARDREATDGQDGHQSSPFRDGGRIEPSRAKVGRPDGGTVPGIAAFFGFTFSPLMP